MTPPPPTHTKKKKEKKKRKNWNPQSLYFSSPSRRIFCLCLASTVPPSAVLKPFGLPQTEDENHENVHLMNKLVIRYN